MKRTLIKAFSAFAVTLIIISILCSAVFASEDFNIVTMRPGVDNNSFNNIEGDFVFDGEKSKYYVTAVQLNKLTEGESEDVKNLITSQALSKFDGSCYGISATMALFYTGRIDLSKSNYYAVNLKEDADLRKMINYYQLSQYCENKAPAVTKAVSDGKISEDSLKQIVEYAKNGTPFLVTFRTGTLAHTLVACGYEHGDDGTHRVCILDCNKKDDFMYLSVSAKYDSWRFEGLPYETGQITELYFSTLDAFSPLSFKDENKTVYSAVSSSAVFDTVCASVYSSFTLTNAEGKTLTFNNGEFSGEMKADNLKYIANSDEKMSTKIVFTIDDSNEYTVINNGEEIDLTVVGDNGLFFSAQGKNIKKVTANENETVLEGENMEYSASVLSTEDNVEMVNFRGADPDRIVLTANDGATLSDTENGKVHASIVSYGQMYEADLEIESRSLSVHYSDIVKTNHVTGKGSPIAKTVILVLVGAVFAVTTGFAVKKYLYENVKNSRKKEKNK